MFRIDNEKYKGKTDAEKLSLAGFSDEERDSLLEKIKNCLPPDGNSFAMMNAVLGLIILKETNLATEENINFIFSGDLSFANRMANGLKILHDAGIPDKENRQALAQHTFRSEFIALALAQLQAEKILDASTRDCIVKHSRVNQLGEVFVLMHKKNIAPKDVIKWINEDVYINDNCFKELIANKDKEWFTEKAALFLLKYSRNKISDLIFYVAGLSALNLEYDFLKILENAGLNKMDTAYFVIQSVHKYCGINQEMYNMLRLASIAKFEILNSLSNHKNFIDALQSECMKKMDQPNKNLFFGAILSSPGDAKLMMQILEKLPSDRIETFLNQIIKLTDGDQIKPFLDTQLAMQNYSSVTTFRNSASNVNANSNPAEQNWYSMMENCRII